MFMKLFLSKDYVKNLILSRFNDHSDDPPFRNNPFHHDDAGWCWGNDFLRVLASSAN